MNAGRCSIAFKEWAAVCQALGSGRQTIILRKGGIHEGREGFQVEHRRFWLYPTNFHQGPEHLADNAAALLEGAWQSQPTSGLIYLQLLAEVTEVIELRDERACLALAGQHVWSEQTVKQRFHYKRPGLFLLIVQIYRRPEPHVIFETPEFAGCKSWVKLPEALAADNLQPVIDEERFAQSVAAIHAARV